MTTKNNKNIENEKVPIATSKSFLAVGPTLHYSHTNVITFWLLTVITFSGCCLFWSKILTGTPWSFSPETVNHLQSWHIGRFLLSGVSIFEYPWQILVLALLMAILAITPLLTSQLLSFSYSIPLILSVFFLANLPGFALSLLISCIAVACRPLRFRSRFISIALCMLPQLLYWGYFGGAKNVEPIKWGFSFTPWLGAWIIGLAISGTVLGTGHFTRYRPGLIWVSTLLILIADYTLFTSKIGFDELDYQLYVARNNPELIPEFHDRSITKALDRAIKSPLVNKYLGSFFYPTEPIALRKELKREISMQLARDRWPTWFAVPEEFMYQEKRQQLLEQFDFFIKRRARSKRMPIALYYKAILNEYSPDTRIIDDKEILHFYNDYPFERSRLIWYQLYSQFGDCPESLEARWRIAMHWAGQQKFVQADALIADALTMLNAKLRTLQTEQPPDESIFVLFRPPPDSVITISKLIELQRKLNYLRVLISNENRLEKNDSAQRLARFVMLNPYSSDYGAHLDELLRQMSKNDPLRDNVLLAQVKLIADDQLRAQRLAELSKQYQNTDGGMLALYELSLLKIQFWRQKDDSNVEVKKQFLSDARATLADFLQMYPASFCAEQAKKNLDSLPAVEQ